MIYFYWPSIKTSGRISGETEFDVLRPFLLLLAKREELKEGAQSVSLASSQELAAGGIKRSQHYANVAYDIEKINDQ